jgi:hypothetical protein
MLIKKAIKDSKIDVYSPYSVVVKTMELLENVKGLSGGEKKKYIIAAIEEVAKGDDGIAGTADDLIPVSTVNKLKLMVEQDLVGDTIDLIVDATKGEFNLNKAINTGIQCLGICFRKN